MASERRLQFLHISDLHARGLGEREPWRRRRVLGDAWRKNVKTLLHEDGPVDFVFFTGDAAHSGKPEEYGEVTDFFSALLDDLHIGLDRLFSVPGNHDIDRQIHGKSWNNFRICSVSSADQLGISRWMNSVTKDAPLGFDPLWRMQVLERERAYRSWLRESIQRPDLVPDGLGYRCSLQLPEFDFPIHIVGLDTAWLCGDDSDSGRLLLTEN